jgi:hypothetical protein
MRLTLLPLLLTFFIWSCVPEPKPSDKKTLEFEDRITPAPDRAAPNSEQPPVIQNPHHGGDILFQTARLVLNNQCLNCHVGQQLGWGVDRNSTEQLWLAQVPGGLIERGSAAQSQLVRSMVHFPGGNMPLGATTQSFSKAEYDAVVMWIDSLAPEKPLRSCGSLVHGQSESRIRYQTNSVPAGSNCVSEVQYRSCNDGVLSPFSGSFQQASCSVSAPLACGSIAHGGSETRIRFQNTSVPFGSTCVSEVQTRTCSNGVLSAFSGTFNASSCSVQAAASCGGVSNGGTQSRQMYQSPTVAFGSTCVAETQTRTCMNGTFGAFSGSYTFSNCSVSAPLNCGSLNHGQNEKRIRYQTSSVPFGQTCQSQVQTRTCSNGTLSSYSGSFTFDACQVQQPQNAFTQARAVLESRCLSCHTGATTNWGVSAGASEEQWINQTPPGLIIPSLANSSRVVTFMVHSPGGNMPVGFTPTTFPRSEYDLIVNWINGLEPVVVEDNNIPLSGYVFVPGEKVRLGDRNFVAKTMEAVFGTHALINDNIRRKLMAFGGPCATGLGWNGNICAHLDEPYDIRVGGSSITGSNNFLHSKHYFSLDTASADAPLVPESSPVREGYRTFACERLVFGQNHSTAFNGPLYNAIQNIHQLDQRFRGVAVTNVNFATYPANGVRMSDDKIRAAYRLFYNLREPNAQMIERYRTIAQTVISSNLAETNGFPSRFEPYRYLIYALCVAPDWQIP